MRKRSYVIALVAIFPIVRNVHIASASLYSNNLLSSDREGFRLSTNWAREQFGRDHTYDSPQLTNTHLEEALTSADDDTIKNEVIHGSNNSSQPQSHLLEKKQNDLIGENNGVRNIVHENKKKDSASKKSNIKVAPIKVIRRPKLKINSDTDLINRPRVPLIYEIDRRIDRGRITWDFGTRPYTKSRSQQRSQQHRTADNLVHYKSRTRGVSDKFRVHYEQTEQDLKEGGKFRVSIDPLAFSRLIPLLFLASSSFLAATLGTLRLLAPMIISKRILVTFGNLISDWYTGRYFRKTFSRVEKMYIHYYETPATFRALSRTLSQWAVYLALARIMGWMVGISHQPCRSDGRGLAPFCGLLWMGSVAGIGHAFAEAIALWGGPMRLQAAYHPEKTRFWKVVTKPWQILYWMQNPEQWFRMIAEPERRKLNLNPLLFPVTWIPLRLLQMASVAKVLATEPEEYLWCPAEKNQIPSVMRKYLLQLALSDEWVRVFLREKRLGLGIVVAISYYFAMLSLLVSCAMINGKATVLMVPSLIANIISTWMNFVIFWNRYEKRRKTRNIRNQSGSNENLFWLS